MAAVVVDANVLIAAQLSRDQHPETAVEGVVRLDAAIDPYR